MREVERVAAWLLLLSTSSLFLAADAPAAPEFRKLQLKLDVSVAHVLPMAPLEFTVSLTNPTERPVAISTVLTPGAGFLTVFVADGAGHFKALESRDWPTAQVRLERNILPPGGAHSASAYMYHGWFRDKEGGREQGYVLPRPGVYRLKTALVDATGSSIESNIVEVKVAERVGQEEKAFEFLRSLNGKEQPDVFRGFLMRTCGRTVSKSEQNLVKKQEEFLKQFGETGYAPYVQYSLGWTLTTAGGESYARGLKLLEQAAASKHSYLATNGLFHLAELSVKRGDLGAARRYVADLRKRYPDSKETNAAAAMLDRSLSTTAPSRE